MSGSPAFTMLGNDRFFAVMDSGYLFSSMSFTGIATATRTIADGHRDTGRLLFPAASVAVALIV